MSDRFETHTFNLLNVVSQELISDLQLHKVFPRGANWTLEFVRSTVLPGMVARMVGWFASQQHVVRVEYPADWWQAVKERWFPSWALGRWPVKHIVKSLDARTIWPNFPYPAEWGNPIQFVIERNEDEAA